MEREIALDTETTGISPKEGHRIIEIGCVEMINRIPTGNNYHVYINPQREVSEGAFRVHGLSNDFLSDKPLFNDVADDFVNFIGDSKLVIHNADFDMGFLNAELFSIKKPEIRKDRVFCTLKYARKKFPGGQNSLDALCRKFNIDNTHRTLHGALLDSEILAEVYMELLGGKQVSINLSSNPNNYDNSKEKSQKINHDPVNEIIRKNFETRKFPLTDEEISAHRELSNKIENSLWKKLS